MPATRPVFRLTRLHIEGLRALRHVEWPKDGLGWGERIPDVVLVGGVNGSGKTTLLDVIFDACSLSSTPVEDRCPPGSNLYLAFELGSRVTGAFSPCVAVGSAAFKGQVGATSQSRYYDDPRVFFHPQAHDIDAYRQSPAAFMSSDLPSVIYLPSNRRFSVPSETYKSAGKRKFEPELFYRFKASSDWKDSLEARLYSAHWEDMTAKEEGRPTEANHFDHYAQAFQQFFGDTKRLVWDHGELFIEIAATSEKHGLAQLSSGEKQCLLLVGELLDRWRPGSLILIDELELHFHPAWQTRLWNLLVAWQKERGGQVIVTTQSTHLFGIADPDSCVLLGGPLV